MVACRHIRNASQGKTDEDEDWHDSGDSADWEDWVSLRAQLLRSLPQSEAFEQV
jgi:hypothetical protein